jgi:DeoR family ulaG and ulaABCDEF operon transcriptional repressor
MDIKDLFLAFEKRRKFNHEVKEKIARRCMDLINTGDEIFLGAGTTVSYLGEYLAQSDRHFMLKIWTNNLFVLNLWLKKYERFFLENFVGIVSGEISRKNLSIVDIHYNFSRIQKVIIGSPGISIRGLSSDDINTVQQVEHIIRKAGEVIILADSSKIGRECTYQTRSMRMMKIDIKNKKRYTLITNEGKGDIYTKTIKRLKESGINIVLT